MQTAVRDLFVYPLKSAAGIRLDRAGMGDRGFELDRRWMVVDDAGEFISQRSHPELALVEPTVNSNRLVLERPVDGSTGPGGERTTIEVPREPSDGERGEVEVWGDRVDARRVGPEADRWLTAYLERSCRLVYLSETADRAVDDSQAGTDDQVSFADGYPYLLTSYASLRALNERLGSAIAIDRFRPNIVIEGTEPFEEDRWTTVRVGEAVFLVAEPCLRCSVTTVDQATGERGREPLETLAEFRQTDDGVAFGQNLLDRERATIQVGDYIEVLEATPASDTPPKTNSR